MAGKHPNGFRELPGSALYVDPGWVLSTPSRVRY